MMRQLAIAFALVLIVLSGIGQGFLSGRWRSQAVVSDRLQRLAGLPSTIGDWQGRDLEMDAGERDLARIDGYVMRDYLNRRTGDRLSLLIVCGRPGPISVHTPDVCYR